jgi:hypothetical protein
MGAVSASRPSHYPAATLKSSRTANCLSLDKDLAALGSGKIPVTLWLRSGNFPAAIALPHGRGQGKAP